MRKSDTTVGKSEEWRDKNDPKGEQGPFLIVSGDLYVAQFQSVRIRRSPLYK